MVRPRSTTPELDDRIGAMARGGLSAAAIVERLKSEGTPCPSMATVSRIIRRVTGRQRIPAPKARRKTKPKPKPDAKRSAAAAHAPPLDDDANASDTTKGERPVTDDEQRALLSSLLRGVVADARTARSADNTAAALASARLASALSSAITRIPTDIPPPDPNEQPDMIATAEACRAKIWDYLERAREGK